MKPEPGPTLTIDTESEPGAWEKALAFTPAALEARAAEERRAAEIDAALAKRKAKRPAFSARSARAARTRKMSPG